MIATDAAGEILFWNEAAEALFGWSAEEAMGRNIVDVTPSLASQPEAVHIMKQLRSAESWSGEFEVRNRDGSTFRVVTENAPVLDRFGKLVGIMGVSRRAEDG